MGDLRPSQSEPKELTQDEHYKLRSLEKRIQTGWNAFLSVGYALVEIKEKKLFRESYSSFSEYCHERWKFSRAQAYRLIDAVEVMEDLSAQLEDSCPLPSCESQLREIKKLLPRKRASFWKELVADPDNNHLTAKLISQKISNIMGESNPTKLDKTKSENIIKNLQNVSEQIEALKSKELSAKFESLYQEIRKKVKKHK